jgi:hypothetical protein
VNRTDLATRTPRVAHAVPGNPFTGALAVPPTVQRSA